MHLTVILILEILKLCKFYVSISVRLLVAHYRVQLTFTERLFTFCLHIMLQEKHVLANYKFE